jgi:hypothetical protein
VFAKLGEPQHLIIIIIVHCPSVTAALLLNPPINPVWSQTAVYAQSPFPFYVGEPHYLLLSCSVKGDNGTPREPVMPLHV